MNIFKTMMIVPIACMVSLPVYAHQYGHDGHSRFDKRLERQHFRIREGVKSGELTRKEASKLRHQQKKIAKLERKLSRDGHLTKQERKKLEKRQDKASNRIYRFKHNDLYRDHHRKHHKPHRAHHYGYQLSDNDGWAMLLKLNDSF